MTGAAKSSTRTIPVLQLLFSLLLFFCCFASCLDTVLPASAISRKRAASRLGLFAGFLRLGFFIAPPFPTGFDTQTKEPLAILPAKPSGLQFCSLFSYSATPFPPRRTMPDIECIRAEIERMRIQVHRQRGEIRQLQRAGISTASAETLLDRMLHTIDRLCEERDRLKKEQRGPNKGKCWVVEDGEQASRMVRRQRQQPRVD
jgi:hypothetical protein